MIQNIVARFKSFLKFENGQLKINMITIFTVLFAVGFISTIAIYAVAPSGVRVEDAIPDNPANVKKVVTIGSSSSEVSSNSTGQTTNSEVEKSVKGKIKGTYLTSDQPYSDIKYLKEQGLSFVYFRASVGSSNGDSMYTASTDRAKSAGIPFGAVLQFDSGSNAYGNYVTFRNTVGDNAGTMPIAIEVSSLDGDTLANVPSVIASIRYQYPNSKILVRTDSTIYDQLAAVIPADVSFWLIANDAKSTDARNELIQYSMASKVGTGIREFKLPMSIFNGTKTEFTNLIGESND